MADHSKPTLTSNYSTEFIPQLDGRFDDLTLGLDPARTSPTNLPQYAIRWSSAAKKWQLWNGSAWVDLESEYAINIGGSAATLKTARTIALSGGATGTATSFNGSANITIPVTALDASKLSGTIPSGLLDGKADKAITIVGTGYLTGGGSLAANRAIDLDSVVKAKFDRFLPAYTFAEIDALTQDEGPIICSDMAGDMYVWVSTAYFTGYRNPRSGLWYGGASDTPEAWELLATGGTWSTSNPKHARVIARYREWGRTVASGSWTKGWNHIADLGGGNWKAPDLRDVFQRMSGTDADTANAAAAGDYKEDTVGPFTMRLHGQLLSLPGAGSAGFALHTGVGSTTSTTFISRDDPHAETAPQHTRVAAVICV